MTAYAGTVGRVLTRYAILAIPGVVAVLAVVLVGTTISQAGIPQAGLPQVGRASAEAEFHDLDSLAAAAGEAPGTDYGRLRIPVLGVDAPIGAVPVGGETAVLPNPQGPGDIAWYDLSAWPGLGGAPGAGGNAILSAHVDYSARVPYAGVRYHGPGAFARITELRPNDEITVTVGTETLRYRVSWVRAVSAVNGTEWAGVLSDRVDRDSITLVTCGGEFDFGSRSYDERVVVRASRVTGLRTSIGVTDTEDSIAPLLLDPAPGCTVEQIWIQEPGGQFIGFLAQAPAFVNQAFPARLAAQRPYIQVCRYFL